MHRTFFIYISFYLLALVFSFCEFSKKEDTKEAQQKKMELDKKLQEVNFDSLILEIPYKPDELFKKATEAYISKNYNESSAYIRNATEMLKMIPIKDSILNIQMDQQINSLNDLAQEIRDRRIFDVNRLEEEFSNTNKLMADFDLNIEKDTRAF